MKIIIKACVCYYTDCVLLHYEARPHITDDWTLCQPVCVNNRSVKHVRKLNPLRSVNSAGACLLHTNPFSQPSQGRDELGLSVNT